MAGLHESKYKKEDNWGEINGCDDDRFVGPRIAPRPKTYCMQVSMLDTLKVSGHTTLSSSLGVGGNASVAGTLSCGSLCFGAIDWGCADPSASGNILFPGNVEFAGDVFVGPPSSISSSATGNPESRAGKSANLFVAGSTRLIEDLTVDGLTSLSGRLLASGGITTYDVSAVNLKSSGLANLTTVTTSRDLTVKRNLITDSFVFQDQLLQLMTVEVIVGVNFKTDTVTKREITYLGLP